MLMVEINPPNSWDAKTSPWTTCTSLVGFTTYHGNPLSLHVLGLQTIGFRVSKPHVACFFGNSMFLVNLLNIRKRIENFQSAEKTCERDSGKQLVVLHANTSNTQYVMINVPTSKIMKFAFMLRKHGMCWKNMCRINLATLLDATVMPPKNRIYEWTLYPCGPNNDMSLREETTGPCVGNTLQRRPFFFSEEGKFWEMAAHIGLYW